jgi:hypothetical protein
VVDIQEDRFDLAQTTAFSYGEESPQVCRKQTALGFLGEAFTPRASPFDQAIAAFTKACASVWICLR